MTALREQKTRQAADHLAAGPLLQDNNLAFASIIGTPLDNHNVRRQFRKITDSAGLGTIWVPRELRHTFVSLLSAHGVPVEAIALLAGHNQTATTELVYRHQIVPALTPRRGHRPDLQLRVGWEIFCGMPSRTSLSHTLG